MRGRRDILILALLVWAGSAMGTEVESYFHSAANYYINGKYAEALRDIQAGLQLNPNDAKLNELLKKIEDELQRQQPSQGDQQDQGEQEQQQQQQQQQDQQAGNEQDQQQEQQGEQDQQQQAGAQEQQEQQQAINPEEMSREDAERILQALEGQEKDVLKNRKLKGGGKRRSAKDW